MAYDFLIKQNSTLPPLQMEFIDDGRNYTRELSKALLSADVYFTMTNIENGIKHISNNKASILLKSNKTCDEKYIIEYQWKPRDTKNIGVYKGEFKIIFPQDLKIDNITIPKGVLTVPISQELYIHII